MSRKSWVTQSGESTYSPWTSPRWPRPWEGGSRVKEPGELEKGVEEMLGHRGPYVLDVVVDPNERPMPPKLTFRKAKNYIISIFKEVLEPT